MLATEQRPPMPRESRAWGQNPAVGPVMNVTQEDPALAEGPVFPQKSSLEWE